MATPTLDRDMIISVNASPTTTACPTPVNEAVLNLSHPPSPTDEKKENLKGKGTSQDPYVVAFEPGDPEDPRTWSKFKKWVITGVASNSVCVIAITSSAYSGAAKDIGLEYNASSTLVTAGISLFVLGFAMGPLIWSPLSEIYGRRIPLVGTLLVFTLFQIPCAISPNLTTLLVSRCIAGTFSASTLTLSAALISDMFEAGERGMAMTIFSVGPFFGPVLGPIVGGLISGTKPWRITFWVMFALAAQSLLGHVFLQPETYHPSILQKKSKRLTKETGKVHVSIFDVDHQKETHLQKIGVSLTRPFVLLFTEGMVFLFALYSAVVYGILYLTFAGYPIIFQQARGWSTTIGGLSFIGIGVGTIIGAVLNFWDCKKYEKETIEANGAQIPPERRLKLSCVAVILMPIGLWGFAATCTPNIHWIAPIIFSVLFGTGCIISYISVINYLVDSYTRYAASCIASNTVFRALFGAAFPLFAKELYGKLGLIGGNCLIAGLATLIAPVPFLFMKYGPIVRRNSKYVPS